MAGAAGVFISMVACSAALLFGGERLVFGQRHEHAAGPGLSSCRRDTTLANQGRDNVEIPEHVHRHHRHERLHQVRKRQVLPC